ncbi:phospholipid phosphatase 5-like isoform X3 [Zophobas morio]|uniref:phospholipid phosphatase 5-like isoform X3 n=1 Tax=Zophobas morio TaxID=2755281 RepID=UPI003083CB0F
MEYKSQCNIFIETAVRLIIWLLFSYFDQSDPFIRNIHENEIWKYQFQVTRSYVPNKCLWALLIIVPSILFIHDFCQNKNKKDVGYGCLALSLSYCLTALITAYIKVLTGRPRPDFYYRCFPQGSGNDYTLCTGKREICMDGRKSFPSGHASLAFAYNRRGESWQLCLCLVPILSAAAIAISRTCDYHHHYEDVVAGSLMGSVISYMCYKLYFPNTTSTFVQEIN